MKAETKSETVSKRLKYKDMSLDMHQPRRTMKGVTKRAIFHVVSPADFEERGIKKIK